MTCSTRLSATSATGGSAAYGGDAADAAKSSVDFLVLTEHYIL
jgi:hypothetical protein